MATSLQRPRSPLRRLIQLFLLFLNPIKRPGNIKCDLFSHLMATSIEAIASAYGVMVLRVHLKTF